jgi:ClpP class serine protease
MIPNLWLIIPEATPPIEQAYTRAPMVLSDFTTRERAKAASEVAKHARATADLKVTKGEAQIRVVGPLVAESDWILDYFGIEYTTYSDLRRQLALAKDDRDVSSIALQIESPGGMVAGLFDVLADLEAFPKPKRASAKLAASAAYAIAANAGRIEAKERLSTFGSIGVVASYWPSAYIDITSTAAPDKRPDPKTEQGRSVIRAYLDEIHDLFATAIGSGRGISAAAVNENYGGGRVFTAGPSLEKGLIDSIAGESSGKTATKATKGKNMDIHTLKAEHPALYAKAFADGEAAEHLRVTSHLKLGEACGNVAVALAPIRNRVSIADAQSDYLAAHMTRTGQAARQADDGEVARALGGRNTEATSPANEQAFIQAFNAEMHVTTPLGEGAQR